MKIEILHGRDPDSSCDMDVYVDGVRVEHVTVESIDPGAGYEVEMWDEHTDWVEAQEDYSPAFRQAVVAERQEARSSDYVVGDKEEDR